MGLGPPPIACAARIKATYSLGYRTFTSCSQCILGLELRGALALPRRLHRHKALLRQNRQATRCRFSLGAVRPNRTAPSVLPPKSDLNFIATTCIDLRLPVDTLLPCWATHNLVRPVDLEIGHIIAFASACLPTWVNSH